MRTTASFGIGAKDLSLPKRVAENGVLVRAIEKELQEAGAASPEAERRWLIEHVTGAKWIDLMTGRHTLTPAQMRRMRRVIAGRKKGEPLAYLLGEAPFWGRLFKVTKDVLIPRPETERLVEETLKVIDTHYRALSPRILDMGTGSGCIALSLTLERPACRMTALDVSGPALKIARKNRRILGLQKKVTWVQGRFFAPFRGKAACWDIVVSNPPYIPAGKIDRLQREVRREPRLALDGGRSGLDAVETLLKEAPKYLAPNGWLLLEIGDDQAAKIRRKTYAGFGSMHFEKDLNGIERVLIAQRDNG